jgi:hypothetical protein
MHGNLTVKINAAAAEQIPEKLLIIINSDYFENFFCHHLGGRVTNSQSSPLIFFYPQLQFQGEAEIEILTPCSFVQKTDEELSSKVSLATPTSQFVLEISDKIVTYPEHDGRMWNRLIEVCDKVTVVRGEDSKRYFKIVLKELPTCCFVSSYFYRMGYF